MRKNCSKTGIKPAAIYTMALILITAMLFSSCSLVNEPAENQTQALDSTEVTPGATEQSAENKENNQEESDDANMNKSVDIDVADFAVDGNNEIEEFDAAKDMQLGALKADMPKDELEQIMESELTDSTTKNEYGMETETLTYKDGTVINLLDGKIYSISVKSSDYATPRGLKTGDTEETLRQLYGEPTTVEDDKWIYSYRGYDLFFVTVINGIVTEIMVSQVM